MILNGLGFIGRTLYLYSEYFEDKPIDHLLGIPVNAQQIDDNVLGRTLDPTFPRLLYGIPYILSIVPPKSFRIFCRTAWRLVTVVHHR